jgi:hypothetical protein
VTLELDLEEWAGGGQHGVEPPKAQGSTGQWAGWGRWCFWQWAQGVKEGRSQGRCPCLPRALCLSRCPGRSRSASVLALKRHRLCMEFQGDFTLH